MPATLQIYLPQHSYHSVYLDPITVHEMLKNLVSDTHSYKVMSINVKKYNSIYLHLCSVQFQILTYSTSYVFTCLLAK